MRVSPELIVGNAILEAVEQGMVLLDFNYFVRYQERLVLRLQARQIDFSFTKLTTSDVMDVAYCGRPYLSFELPIGYSRFRNIKVVARAGAELNALKDKFNIYYREFTPDWLLSAMRPDAPITASYAEKAHHA